MLGRLATRAACAVRPLARAQTAQTRAGVSVPVAALSAAPRSHLAGARAFSGFSDPSNGGSPDNYFNKYAVDHQGDSTADTSGRTAHYLMLGGARVLYASTARLLAIKFISSMSASADVLALSTVEIDLSKIAVGTSATVKWRGKPVFVRHRPPAEIEQAKQDDTADLRDNETDAARTKEGKPEWLVVIGVCTHLGCVPIGQSGDYKGWFCPCHGSHYDTSGRIRKGPAPLNLEVPTYKFLTDTSIVVG